jgi:hypothetical protein
MYAQNNAVETGSVIKTAVFTFLVAGWGATLFTAGLIVQRVAN